MDRFGWDRDMGTPTHDRLLTDWMDALQDFPLDEVQRAIRDQLAEAPSKMPNEAHIRARVMANRAAWLRLNPPPRPEEAPRVRVSAERAAEIIDEVNRATEKAAKRMKGNPDA